jgi:Uma2 family endonuclease
MAAPIKIDSGSFQTVKLCMSIPEPLKWMRNPLRTKCNILEHVHWDLIVNPSASKKFSPANSKLPQKSVNRTAMTYTPAKTLTFDQFIAQYSDESCYELADGELIDMEPTGPHETVSGKLVIQIGIAITNANYPWFIPRTCLIQPFGDVATARRPDIVVLDETFLVHEPRWQREPVITLGRSIKLVVEVVSTNWETDYARKVEEYALLGVPEYWIVDYRGLGGISFIGKPKQPTFTVCQLEREEYRQHQYRLGEAIASGLLPDLQLQLNDVLPR